MFVWCGGLCLVHLVSLATTRVTTTIVGHDLVGSGKTYQRVANTNITIDVGKRVNILCAFNGRLDFEQKAQLANLDSLFANIYTVEIVENNGFEDEITATAAPLFPRAGASPALTIHGFARGSRIV